MYANVYVAYKHNVLQVDLNNAKQSYTNVLNIGKYSCRHLTLAQKAFLISLQTPTFTLEYGTLYDKTNTYFSVSRLKRFLYFIRPLAQNSLYSPR